MSHSKSTKSYVSAPSQLTQSSRQAAVLNVTRTRSIFIHDFLSSKSGRQIILEGACGPCSRTSPHFIPQGTVILSVQPRVFVLSNQYLDSYCSSCANAATTSLLMRCSGCGTLRYCNAVCQRADWNSHRSECSALQKWAQAAPSTALSVPSDAVRCLGRILWKIKSLDLDSKEIQAMQSHKVSNPASVEAHTHLAHSLVRYLGLTAPSDLDEYGIKSSGDLVGLISRFITNTFALTSPSLTPIGVTISPLVAFTNHSCLPNVAIVFPRCRKPRMKEPVMDIIALRDIKADEEMTMAYIDTTLPRTQRQMALSETYNFTCQCPLCKPAANFIDPREALLCPKSCGGTCPIPNEATDSPVSRCSACKAAITDPHAVMDAIRIGQEALDKATRLQFIDASKAKQLTTNMIPILASAGLSLSCHPLLALSKLHQSLLLASSFSDPNQISQEDLDESIRTAARNVMGLTAVLEEGHPVRGVALAELGKLLAVDEPSPSSSSTPPEEGAAYPPSGPARLKIAYETLLRARRELLIGFGTGNEGGEVCQELRTSIVALERELGIWTGMVRNASEDRAVNASRRT